MNRFSGAITDSRAYPERPETRESFADRVLADAGHWLGAVLRHGRGDDALFCGEVLRCAQRLGGSNLAPRARQLRYQLRRNGPTTELLAEVFGVVAAGFSEAGRSAVSPQVFTAARLAVQGRIAGLPDRAERAGALGLAAAAFALAGTPVTLISASDARARETAAAIGPVLARLGLAVDPVTAALEPAARRQAFAADVVCSTFREIAYAYLRDRLLLGGAPRFATLERLAGDAPAQDHLALRGLQCALVDDADIVLIDDSRAPVVISADMDHSQERLLYEQAIELARTLRADADFYFGDDGPALTASGSGRLARLTQPLGGLWSGQLRREELLINALSALHLMENGRDYQVSAQRIVFPEPDAGAPDTGELADPVLRRLLEVKEGLKLSGKRDILARISASRFFRRFLHMGGVCADARGLERELWKTYRLATEPVVEASRPHANAARVFVSTPVKLDAVIQTARHLQGAGAAAVIAARTQASAKALLEALTQAGFKPGFLRGAEDEAERAALSALHTPGAVTVSLYPAHRSVSPGAGPGPCVLIAEAHDSARQVAHLLRAFAPYRAELLISLDEEAVASQLAGHPLALAAALAGDDGALPPRAARWLAARIQQRLERAHRIFRAETQALERHLGDLLAFSGARD